MEHRTPDALLEGLVEVRASPLDDGRVDLIVRRPGLGEREVLEEGVLDVELGLVGDTWSTRPSNRTEDGSPHPDMQLNLINARASALFAVAGDRRPLAGDQLHLDLDLSEANLPAGTRLGLGTAVIEITDQPHNGCAKFAERFGRDALRLVNSPEGRAINLRGRNAKVVVAGTVRVGDTVSKRP